MSGATAAWTLWLLALMTFFWATLMGAIGTTALYLIRVYKDVRGRPQYIVESTAGIDSRQTLPAPASTEREPTA